MAGFKALLLDRDGVINIEKNYLYKAKDLEFVDGIFDLVRHFKTQGYKVVVVTNQSGIARGYYTEADLAKLHSFIADEFSKNGASIDAFYHCPHHPDFSGECECRKPKSGMILQAKKDLVLELASSILVGDSERDIEAGLGAGVKQSYLLSNTATTSKATKIVKNLKEIIDAHTK
ncbi:MAG: HAD family hydrolase [Sulfuricurvum sp.]